MLRRPDSIKQSESGTGAAHALHVGCLIGADGSLGTAAMLLEAKGLKVEEAPSVDALLALAKSGSIQAVAVDPELADGWPVDAAERLTAALRAGVPLVVICRSDQDAQIIQQRVARPGVSILQLERHSVEQVVAIIRGLIAAHGARPSIA